MTSASRWASRVLTWCGIGFMRMLARAPLRLVRAMGTALGWTLYALVAPRRRVVHKNLALCFPERTLAERRQMARRTFVYFAQAWLDRSWLWHASPEVLRQRLTLHGAVQEFDGQSPTVVFSPHFYGLDAGATTINMNIDRNFTSIYTPQANELLDRWIRRGRLRFGRVRLFHRLDGVRANANALRSGEVLYLLSDMDFGRSESIFVPFYGVPTATVPSVSRFARLGRAKVISVVTRLTASGYAVEVMPVWKDFPTADVAADTARVNVYLEQLINTMPEQYYWVHKRFKTRPDGEASLY
ncbi:MAG: lipid biosynthesis acyltransferase [Polaromonas sp.]|nr:lipid biosynthesis acyltransferase [Polaromonas sp.]